MWILFAAPFVVLAGVVFTLLSLVPGARRWAIPVATGVVGAEPASLVGLRAVAYWINHPPLRPTGHSFLVEFICAGALTGLTGGIVTWFAARWVAAKLPAILLRLVVFVAGSCSYGAVLAALLLWAGHRFGLRETSALAWGVELFLAFLGAWTVSGRAEEFRPRPRVRSAPEGEKASYS